MIVDMHKSDSSKCEFFLEIRFDGLFRKIPNRDTRHTWLVAMEGDHFNPP